MLGRVSLDNAVRTRRMINVDKRYDRRSLVFSFINCSIPAPKTEVSFYLIDGKPHRVGYGKESDYSQVGRETKRAIAKMLKEVSAIDNDPAFGGVQVSTTSFSINTVCDVNEKIANKVANIIANELFDGDIEVNIPRFDDYDESSHVDKPIDECSRR